MSVNIFFYISLLFPLLWLIAIPVSIRNVKSLTVFFLLAFSTLILVFRGVNGGKDTIKYYQAFSYMAEESDFSLSSMYFAYAGNGVPIVEPFFGIISLIIANLGGSFELYLYIYTFLCLCVLFFAYSRFTKNYILLFLLFLCSFTFVFLFGNAIRQAMAVSLITLALSYVFKMESLDTKERNNKKFYLLCFFASLFHYFAIVFIIFPLVNSLSMRVKFILLVTFMILSVSGLFLYLASFIPIGFIRMKFNIYLSQAPVFGFAYFSGWIFTFLMFVFYKITGNKKFASLMNIYFSIFTLNCFFINSEVAFGRFSQYRFVLEPILLVHAFVHVRYNPRYLVRILLLLCTAIYFVFVVYNNESVIDTLNLGGF